MRIRTARRSVVPLIIAAAALIALSGSAQAMIGDPAQPHWITSDKEDYAPGELVTLTGGNWQPGEVVHIRVNDDLGETWRRDVDVLAGEDVGCGQPDEDVRALQGRGEGPGETARVGVLRRPLPRVVQVVTVGVQDAVGVGDDHVTGTRGEQQLEHGGPGRARAGHDDAHIGKVLADDPQRVGQGRQRDDRRPVLVVVEHRDVEQVA